MEKKRQEHFKNLPRCTKGLIFPHWPEGVCNPECGECSPSDPPSPEMVCPRNKEPIIITANMGEWKCPNCYKILIFHTKDDSIKIQNIIDHKCDIHSPEPPEKVRLTDDEIKKIEGEVFYQHTKLSRQGEYTAPFEFTVQREVANAQILKLQQAGWGDLKEAQAELIELRERVDAWENLEASVCPEDVGLVEYVNLLKVNIAQKDITIAEMSKEWKAWDIKVKAEARQQAFQEISKIMATWRIQPTIFLQLPKDLRDMILDIQVAQVSNSCEATGKDLD